MGETRKASAVAVPGDDAAMFPSSYELRFEEDLRFKKELWRILVEDFFQAYIQPEDTVVDLGAGNCEFINAVSLRTQDCGRSRSSNCGFRGGCRGSAAAWRRPGSNRIRNRRRRLRLELLRAPTDEERPSGHPPGMPARSPCRRQAHRLATEHQLPAGPLLGLPRSPHRSLASEHDRGPEAQRVSRRARRTEVPFVQGQERRIPRSGMLVRAYLRLRPAWRIFGRQMLIVSVRR